MPAINLKTSKGVAALIRAQVHLAKASECLDADFNWHVILKDLVKETAIGFNNYVNSKYTLVYSEKLNVAKWVHTDNGVLVNGSDLHYTELIKNHGRFIDELYIDYLKTL